MCIYNKIYNVTSWFLRIIRLLTVKSISDNMADDAMLV